MFQRGKRNEMLTGPWHFADAAGCMPAPTWVLAGTMAVASVVSGCSGVVQAPGSPPSTNPNPTGGCSKGRGAAAGPGSPTGEGWAALPAGREQAGGGRCGTWVGAGKDWTQTKLFFAMKRKTTPLLPGLYICMFFPLQ